MKVHLVAPRFGVTGERLDAIAKMVTTDTSAAAEALGTSKAAVITAMTGVLAGMAAEISLVAAADFFHALATSIRNAGSESELDARRVDRTAAALFEADQRRK